jgi:phosphate-selective porin OprO/OprP
MKRQRGFNRTAKETRIAFCVVFMALLYPLAGLSEDKPVPAVTASKAFKLSGYAQLLGTIQESGVDSAAVRRLRFALSGEIVKNLKAKFTIDVVRSPVLIDAQLEAAFSEALNLRFGQFLVPFGVESSVSTADLDTINRSQPVDKLAPGRDIGTLGRDVGLALTGKISLFDYTVGVFNGTGANKADTNDNKDFAGRLGVRPLEFLSVGASLYKGSYNTSVGAPSTRRDRTGFDAGATFGDVSLKGEYVWAVDDATDKRGWFAQAGWFVLPKTFQVLAKFDSFDKNVSAANDRTSLYTFGLNWFFAERTKLQVNFEYLRNESGRMANQALLVQFQAGF